MIRRMLARAAMRAAADPRVQERAADVYEREIKPRARAVVENAKPTVQAARDDLRAAAHESDPRRDPVGFAKALKRRFVDFDR